MIILRIWLYTFIAATLLVGVVACGQTVATPTAVPTAIPSSTATIAAATLQPGDLERTLTVNGVERTYLLHIPPGLDSTKPVPVVFAFHGYDIEIYFEISDLQNMTGFNDIADQSGFLLVYPKGISGVWNAGTCCGSAAENNVDEVSFVRQILSDLGTIASVDAKRIYATGFSMGGMLSYRLACEMSDTFAAIAPVVGALVYDPCQPAQPVSVMQVHGMSDTAIPYAGGVGLFMSGNNVFPPVEQEIATWVQLDGCTGSAQVETQGITTHTVYASCQAGTAVELYTLDALGNNWPSQYVLPVSQMIWDFFAAHPKQ
jgi:polyhydroxybutyrate depolymerase